MKKAVFLLGAGASLEFGAPSTRALTEAIEPRIAADSWLTHLGADRAYQVDYFREPPNLEHIYHCAHELIYHHEPTPGAVQEYLPLLFPFVEWRDAGSAPSERCLRGLSTGITVAIYDIISEVCGSSRPDLGPLRRLIDKFRRKHVTRIYTTNYDDFVHQACPELYTGFGEAEESEGRRFDFDGFWSKDCEHSLFHLHGSVHMGFHHGDPDKAEIGELFWFDDLEQARIRSKYNGSGE